jgi:hypothetical protein
LKGVCHPPSSAGQLPGVNLIRLRSFPLSLLPLNNPHIEYFCYNLPRDFPLEPSYLFTGAPFTAVSTTSVSAVSAVSLNHSRLLGGGFSVNQQPSPSPLPPRKSFPYSRLVPHHLLISSHLFSSLTISYHLLPSLTISYPFHLGPGAPSPATISTRTTGRFHVVYIDSDQSFSTYLHLDYTISLDLHLGQQFTTSLCSRHIASHLVVVASQNVEIGGDPSS